jgi:hypothetical protein
MRAKSNGTRTKRNKPAKRRPVRAQKRAPKNVKDWRDDKVLVKALEKLADAYGNMFR